LDAHDFSINSRKAFIQDIRKFAEWFSLANGEPFHLARVTVRDLTDFRDWLRRERGQEVATVNRCMVTHQPLGGDPSIVRGGEFTSNRGRKGFVGTQGKGEQPRHYRASMAKGKAWLFV
jgi:hypothetical protein